MDDTVYVYHEYNDEQAYGTQIICLFHSRIAGMAYLAERVKLCTGMSLEDWKKEPLDEMDTVSDTYVSLGNGDGTEFYILEEAHFND